MRASNRSFNIMGLSRVVAVTLLCVVAVHPAAAEINCDASRKEPKGAGKLKQLIQKETVHRKMLKEAREDEWKGFNSTEEAPLDKQLNQMMSSSGRLNNSDCVRSHDEDPVQYPECREADLEAHKTGNTLLAAFTNGRLGNQVQAKFFCSTFL